MLSPQKVTRREANEPRWDTVTCTVPTNTVGLTCKFGSNAPLKPQEN